MRIEINANMMPRPVKKLRKRQKILVWASPKFKDGEKTFFLLQKIDKIRMPGS